MPLGLFAGMLGLNLPQTFLLEPRIASLEVILLSFVSLNAGDLLEYAYS